MTNSTSSAPVSVDDLTGYINQIIGRNQNEVYLQRLLTTAKALEDVFHENHEREEPTT